MGSKRIKAAIYSIGIFFLCFYVTSAASAAMLFDIGVTETYEDNINGSPIKEKREGDSSTVPFLSLGGYTRIGKGKTYLTGIASGQGYLYHKFEALNASFAALNGSVYHGFGKIFSLQIGLKGKYKNFRGDFRDSKAWGGTVELKQQWTPKFWIKEGYEYENNIARSDRFSYTGHSGGIWMGYLPIPRFFLTLGYAYSSKAFEGGTDFETQTQTGSASATARLTKKAYLSLGYSRSMNKSSVAGTDYNSNIYTAGVSYSY